MDGKTIDVQALANRPDDEMQVAKEPHHYFDMRGRCQLDESKLALVFHKAPPLLRDASISLLKL